MIVIHAIPSRRIIPLFLRPNHQLRLPPALAIRRDPDRQLARLDHVLHVDVPEGKLLFRQRVLDAPRLAGREHDLLETFKLADGPGDACSTPANIKLYDLHAVALAGVGDGRFDSYRAVAIQL